LEPIQKENLKKVIYTGSCFTTLFTAYIAAQNLVSQIYSQLGYTHLGQICLFIYFAFFASMSVIAPHFKKKLSIKAGLISGAACHITFVFAGALTTFCNKYDLHGGFCNPSFIPLFNILCAACLGTGAALIWLCQGTYVDECADEATKGLFNGTFWSILQTSQIFSSALAAFVLGSTDEFTFYSILLIFGFSSIVMFNFVQTPTKSASNQEPATQADQNLTEALKGFAALLQEKKYYFLFLGIIFSGIAIGCYISYIASAVDYILRSSGETETSQIHKSIGYVLLVLSFGEVAAGLSVGRLADIHDKIKLFTITILLNEAALLLTFLACLFNSYKLALLGGLFFGYGDTAIQTMINSLIGSMFNGRPELFSAYRFFQSIGLTYAALLTVFVPKGNPLLYIILIGGSMLTFHTLYNRYRPDQDTNNTSYDRRPLLELKNLV